MVGLTDATAQSNASSLVTAYPYIALFTATGTDSGAGFTEVSGNSYTRVSSTWGASSGSSPTLVSNDLITFPTASGSWGNVISVGGYSQASGGVLGWWDYIGAFDWTPFTCSAASPGILTVPGSATSWSLSNGDRVVVSSEFGGALPSLSSGSWAGLLTVSGLSGDTFNVGLNCSSTGSGMARKVATVNPSTGVVFSIPAGQLVMKVA